MSGDFCLLSDSYIILSVFRIYWFCPMVGPLFLYLTLLAPIIWKESKGKVNFLVKYAVIRRN